jgi:type II secretory pathway pseudopilin PulG
MERRLEAPLLVAALLVMAVIAIGALAILPTTLAAGAQRGAAGPAAHVAAVCADYSSQAAAQQAADTRDADGDGIYCESLPCPCSSAAAGGGGQATPTTTDTTEPMTPAKVKLGPSVTPAPVTQHTGCTVDGPLPDGDCTPGAKFKYATKAKVCVKGYSQNVRNVSTATKNAVYAAYGLTTHFNGTTGEVDHLVSLELGGSNARSNLFPEAASPTPGSHEKDRLENKLHSMVCAATMTLRAAQEAIAHDWVTAYRRYVVG